MSRAKMATTAMLAMLWCLIFTVTLRAQIFTRITTGNIVTDGGNSHGSSWGDYDDDGDLDLFVTNESVEGNFLYQNDGNGSFIKITGGTIVHDGGNSLGACWGDYDNDNDLDLFVANQENNFLYQNNGDGTFNKISSGAIVTDGGNSRGCSWGDYDNDGDLDLFVANSGGANNFLYENNGDGMFTRITSGSIVNDGGFSLGPSWGDYDNDGDLDLFVANIFGENNFLYQNDVNGFTKIKTGPIVTDGGHSFGGSWDDYDSDGDLDLFVTNQTDEGNFLYRNIGRAGFTKVTMGSIVNDSGVSEGSGWGDYDNDGDLDLFVANVGGNNFLYQNNGDGTFSKITTGDIVNDGGSSQGAGWCDYDNDGDLDLFVANSEGENNFLYQNDGNNKGWINIRLVGTISNVSAIGAKIDVKAIIQGEPTWQIREISGQTGYKSQNSLNVEFGLGDAATIDSIKIVWPSGTKHLITDARTNRFLTVTETPLITDHTPPLSAEAGNDIALTTTVSGDAVLEVRLNYRQGGEADYTGVTMSVQGNGSFRATIPAGRVTDQGLEYHIIATDVHGNIKRLPPQGNYPVGVHVSEGITTGRVQPNGSEESGYRLISFPLVLDDKSPTAVFEDDLGEYNDAKWRLVEYLPGNATRAGIILDFLDIKEISPGKAYWLLVTDEGKIIDTGSGTSSLTSQEYAIVLNSDWNLIGNPFNFPIEVGNLRLASDNTFFLRTYEGNWNDPMTNRTPRILPFEGYALFNPLPSADTLFINPDLTAAARQITKRNIEKENVNWQLKLVATCQEAKDLDNTLAINPQSASAWDKNDHPEPPVIGKYVSVYFPHPEWQKLNSRFCTDFRPEFQDGEIWEFEVKTNIRDKVHLTFKGVESVPKEFEVWLVDELVNVTRNLREANHYVVAGSESHPKRLKLVVGKSDFVGKELAQIQNIPTDFKLSQNFPNPFNPATTIRYGLPNEERVTLKIYNILGAEVVTLVDNELKSSGYHSAIWDSRNNSNRQVASGLYFLQMRAGKFVQTRKMLLIE